MRIGTLESTIGFMLIAATSARAADIGTAFTYQGSLSNGSGPVTDTCDFRFRLWDAAAAGIQRGATQVIPGVVVTDGVFTVTSLDFGAGAFNGTARWLAIEVQCTGDVSYISLTPRVELRPAPHALALPGLYTRQNATSPNVMGGYAGNQVPSDVVGATICGGGWSSQWNGVFDDFGVVAGGSYNFAGNDDDDPSSAKNAFVGGGVLNSASASSSTVAGGSGNIAFSSGAAVCGGAYNEAGGDGESPFIGGGKFNTATGSATTVAGGWQNSAASNYSMVPGGFQNLAGGLSSFAAGWQAKVRDGDPASPYYSGDFFGDEGAFVWADSTDADFVSTGPDQFLIRASGGVGVNTNSPTDPLTVNGVVRSMAGGFEFPDGTTQTTAATDGGWRDDGTIIRLATITDQVGIGTAAPTQKLDVAGNIHASGTIISGSSITIDGTSGSEKITSSASLEIWTAAGRAFRLENNATSPNVIGGYSGNAVTAGAVAATIAGGGDNNRVTDDYGVVGGGRGNQAGDGAGTTSNQDAATVAGGWGNTASAGFSTVGGGLTNTGSGVGSTVGGGISNTASGGSATVAGGATNNAIGNNAVVPGGDQNQAGGDHSFAAGRRTKVRTAAQVGGGDTDGDQGTFAWADSTNADFTSTGPNQFLIRAAGGTRIYSNSAATIGVQLAAGGNSWSALSDRNVKENFSTIDPHTILQRVVDLPVTIWNLKSQASDIHHIGPMAQDFHASFGVGESDTHISGSDADGVAFAAIQGLYNVVQEKDCQIAELMERDLVKDRRVGELEDRLTRLEAMLSQAAGKGENP